MALEISVVYTASTQIIIDVEVYFALVSTYLSTFNTVHVATRI